MRSARDTDTRGPRRAGRRIGSALAAGALILAGLAPATPAAAAPGDTEYTPEACETFQSSEPQGEPWQMGRLRIPELHTIATGKGVTIAVIDTGVSLGSSPYMTSVNMAPWQSFTGTNLAKDKKVDCWHGSFVVSLIAAKPGADPNHEFSGIAPDVRILALRALQRSEAKADDLEPLPPVVAAVNAAVDAGVDIISISQSGTGSDDYARAVQRAIDAGILVVAASGNGGSAGVSYPANYPGVMAVAMTTPSDVPDEASQFGGGMKISVAAPGSSVVGLFPLCLTSDANCVRSGPAAYATRTGTSFSAPLVAGAAALVMERYPDLTAAEVKRLLEDTADHPVGGVPDEKLGYGIINPYRALMAPREPTAPSGGPSAESSLHVPPVEDNTDHRQRNTALAVAGISLGIMTVTGVIAAALPAGRRRRWRPAHKG